MFFVNAVNVVALCYLNIEKKEEMDLFFIAGIAKMNVLFAIEVSLLTIRKSLPALIQIIRE